METEMIKDKLHKYFEGESTLEEEQMLHDYFQSGQVEEQFLPYQSIFLGIKELKYVPKRTAIQEEELMDFILENEHREKRRLWFIWQAAAGIAAVFLIALLLVRIGSYSRPVKDTFEDPEQAYAVATQTLQYVAAKYHKGMVPLQPVRKLNDAVEPLRTNIEKLDKGFYPLQNLKKVEKPE